jgi:hypothetical protein
LLRRLRRKINAFSGAQRRFSCLVKPANSLQGGENMKKLYTLLLGITLTAMIIMPALADQVRARVKTVDADANTITVVEDETEYSFTVTPDTKFLTVKGTALANGIKSGDLKAGRPVIADYTTQDGKMVLNSLQIQPRAAKTAEPEPTTD